ncbi:hypothetical protein PQX77_010867 [Marasmius sp. AFHP31]|nr:hypothetical protein PQX77_010867 [Marasmius sp. AFHP31]
MSTTAQLTHSQRNRLIKSTRKLGNLLGETPMCEDSSVASTSSKPSGPSHRPALSLSAKSTAIGRPSLSLTRPSTAPETTLPVPPLPSSLTPSPLDTPQRSPFSPTFGPLNRDSPFCPSDSETEASHKADMRKKLAKLCRTFGENVPVELVTISDSLEVGATGGIGTRPPKPLKKTKSLRLQSSKPSLKPIQPNSSPTPTRTITRSASLHTSLRHSPARHSRTTSEYTGNIDREIAFTKLTAQSQDSIPPSPPLEHSGKHVMMTHRKGREWSGEWNADDMAQVVNRLRSLK